MDIFDRNPVQHLNEVVFADIYTKQLVLGKANPQNADNMLFYGPAGTGKSTLCRLIGRHLVGDGYGPDVFTINVSLHSSKTALCNAITTKTGFGGLNNLGKIVIILEELDGADKNAQKALKEVISQLSPNVLFLAASNNIEDIIEPVVDRFIPIKIDTAPPNMWCARAVQVLHNEGVEMLPEKVEVLLKSKANNISGRKIMRELDAFAQKVITEKSKPKLKETV